MKVNYISDKEIKEFLSEDKIIAFINTDQILDYINGGSSVNSFEKRLSRINYFLNLDRIETLKYLSNDYVEIEFDDIEDGKEYILRMYNNIEIRENIYVDLWYDGNFIEENT